MTTIIDVAKRAQVSPGTVSNVLSGKRAVAESTRERVLQAIKELNYQTNIAGYSLVTGSSKTIGVIMTQFELGLSAVLMGIDNAAHERNFSILISKLEKESDFKTEILKLRSRNVDGIVCVIPETIHSRTWKNDEISENIPMTFIFNRGFPSCSAIRVDNVAGGYMATKHILEHGCRKIAHISGLAESIEAKDRIIGWKKSLIEAGIEPEFLFNGGWTAESGKKTALKMLDQCQDVEAVFVGDDDCALGVMSAMYEAGKRVPEDIKIIGFDDARYSEYLNPPLTTVKQDYYGLGQRAIYELCRLISDRESVPADMVLTAQLVIRKSCGC